MIGRTLSHYSIETHLGSGGMGEVYGARDVRLLGVRRLAAAFGSTTKSGGKPPHSES